VGAQAKGNPQLMQFLSDVMVEDYFNETFTKGYGEERAYADGVAHHSQHVFNLLKGLEDG